MHNYTVESILSPTQRLEFIQEINKLLATVREAAGAPIGVEPVIGLMQFSGVYNTSATQPSPTLAEILGEVEQEAGIELSPGLVVLIKNSPYQNVRDAIAIYVKTYGRGGGDKSVGLFYRILETENRRKSNAEI